MSLFGENQMPTFKKYDPGPHHTMKYNICDLFGVRKYASSGNTNRVSDFGFKHTAHTL